MSPPLLIDTDVLIDLLRGQADAVAFVQGLSDPPLVTLNQKHFPMLAAVHVPYSKP